ncbi:MULTISPECIES: SMC-Scp complex subunit ScpB [Rhodomicrobium]|uniref:SMC-Scp complex subunit ScpB n=1 Tax=Rhodomicrobium TaxID=1068 RepID=UPI000B4A9F5A|nr:MULTISPECIES: SMC-Scp complex subunit ScpB [Rhodomicrobium]
MSENDKTDPVQGRLPLPAREPPPAHQLAANMSRLPSADRWEKLRVLEAVLFAAREPMDESALTEYFTGKDDIAALLQELQNLYAGRGVNLMRIAGKWAFRTAPDLAFILERHSVEPRRLSKAALETLAIIAYHQPVTRAEIEEIRGVSTSKGTVDVLLEMGWIRLRGRRRAPGRPVTYGTTDIFLEHFGFDSVKDLPGLSELKGAGLLDSNLPPGFSVPEPNDSPMLAPDEEPLDGSEPADEAEEEAAEEPLVIEPDVPEEDVGLHFRNHPFNLLRQGQG